MCGLNVEWTSCLKSILFAMDPNDPRFRDQFGRLNVDAPSFIPNAHAPPFVPYPYGELDGGTLIICV